MNGRGWSLPKNTGGGIIHNAVETVLIIQHTLDLAVTTNERRIFRGRSTSTKKNKLDKGLNETVGFREFKYGCWQHLVYNGVHITHIIFNIDPIIVHFIQFIFNLIIV